MCLLREVFLFYKPDDIVIDHEKHKPDKETEKDDVHDVCNIRFYRRTFYFFNQEKKQSSAIKRRKWDQVDDCKIDRDERHKRKQVHKTELICVTHHADESDWSGQR